MCEWKWIKETIFLQTIDVLNNWVPTCEANTKALVKVDSCPKDRRLKVTGTMPSIANSSLSYEILMYLNSFYFGMFAVCEVGMGLFKAINLPSPGMNKILMEFTLLFFLMLTECGRIYLGRKGNLTERGQPIIIGIILTVPSSLATLYFLFWQTRVLKLEMILCSIQLVLLITEVIIAIMCLIAIYRPSSSSTPDRNNWPVPWTLLIFLIYLAQSQRNCTLYLSC